MSTRKPKPPLRLLQGRNVRLRCIPGVGTIINFTGGEAEFIGAWAVEMSGSKAASIGYGEINGAPGKIGGVPLNGTKENPTPPVLRLPTLQLDDEGRGYICAEVTCDPEKGFGIVKVEIVQVADPDTNDGAPGDAINHLGGAAPLSGNRARQPLAMLRRRSSGVIDVHQIAYHDYEHRVAFDRAGKPVRHFFY